MRAHAIFCRMRGLRPVALAVVLSLVTVALPATGAHRPPQVSLRWSDQELPVFGPAVTLTPGEGGQVGCAGPADVTLWMGTSLTLPGVAWGEGACASGNPPCVPYAQFWPTMSCAAGAGECCVFFSAPASASGDLGHEAVGCLREFVLEVDVDADDRPDVVLGPFQAFGACGA